MDLIVKDPRGLRIGGKSLEKGDSFTISDREGGLLVAIGKAEPDPKAEKPKAKQTEKPKGNQGEKENQEEKASKGIFSRFKKGGSNEKSKA